MPQLASRQMHHFPKYHPLACYLSTSYFEYFKVKLPCNMRYWSKSLSHTQSHCLAHLAAVIPSFSRLPWPRRTPNREQSSATRRPIEKGETQSIKNWRETDVDEVDFPMLVVPRGCVKKLQCSFKKKMKKKKLDWEKKWIWWSWVAVAAWLKECLITAPRGAGWGPQAHTYCLSFFLFFWLISNHIAVKVYDYNI